jgi:hypothetical protein
MMRAPLRIRVIIEEGRFGNVFAEAAVDLSPDMNEVMTPLKMSDGPFPFFDTPMATVHRVRDMREYTVDRLAPEVAKVLIKAMRSKDTMNGYTIAEQEEFKKGGA